MEEKKEYDIKEYNYAFLEYLRKKTHLGPIALLNIAQAKKQAAALRKYYESVEHEVLELDTSLADELEYRYRMQAMQRVLFKDWEKYGDGLDLEEYTYMAIANNVNNQKNKERGI